MLQKEAYSMQMERYQKYKVASVIPESLDAYASIVLELVWISECFTLSLSRKLQKNIYL